MKTLKMTWAICLVVLTGTFTGCDDLFDGSGLSLNSNYSNMELSVPQSPAGEYIFIEELLPTNIDDAINETNADYSSIKSIILIEATAEILNNENEELNYDAFSSVKVAISTDGLPEKVIAEITEIPDEADELVMDLQNTDVTEYLDAEKYFVTAYAVLDKDIETPMNILVKLRYKITLGF